MFIGCWGIHTKNVEPDLCPVHALKVFALPCLSKPSNAESPTPMYVSWHIKKCAKGTTSQGAFPLLCFWQAVGSCEVLKASKPKRSENAFSMYVSRRSDYPRVFCKQKDGANILNNLHNTILFLFFLLSSEKKLWIAVWIKTGKNIWQNWWFWDVFVSCWISAVCKSP